MKKAVYAGSFDPITNGHLWMVEQGARLFDHLLVAVGVNPTKKYTFSTEERMAMIDGVVKRFPGIVTVKSFEHQYLVNFAYSEDARYILRGIRNANDFEFERGMRQVNADLQPEITTVFLMPPREIAEVSSSFIKGLIGPRGWEEVLPHYVPNHVARFLLEKFRGATGG